MFYYYGGKRRLAGHYPPPEHDTIVEPFAGSAAYAMRYLRERRIRRVVLVEKDERVVDTWQRVLAMTPEALRGYPLPQAGERTTDFLVMTVACSNAIASRDQMKVTPRQEQNTASMLRRMARLLPAAQAKVELICGDYHEAPDIEATWFVDPPYSPSGRSSATNQRPQGQGYKPGCRASDIDYAELGEWCRARQGQRIVCEQAGATWLPFRHLVGSQDALGRWAAEACWADPEYQLVLAT